MAALFNQRRALLSFGNCFSDLTTQLSLRGKLLGFQHSMRSRTRPQAENKNPIKSTKTMTEVWENIAPDRFDDAK